MFVAFAMAMLSALAWAECAISSLKMLAIWAVAFVIGAIGWRCGDA
jgi:hypothetical protein